MADPLLIGVHGLKQTGKSTTYTFIEEWAGALGLSARGRGFADEVKLAVARLFWPDITLEEAVKWADTFKEDPSYMLTIPDKTLSPLETSVTLRQMLQHMGTEVGRQMWGGDFWVDRLLPLDRLAGEQDAWHRSFEAKGYPPDGRIHIAIARVADVCVVSDVRFIEEVERVKALGGMVWKVRRAVAEAEVTKEAQRQDRQVHASEFGLPDELFDAVLYNNETIAHFRVKVQAEIQRLYDLRRGQ